MSVRFARLRIAGFKSFAEAVSVDILPGLTGIVGPNGCGKSNVVEALRWTMGETSARSLRGGEMDDLIFAGTAARPARNLAEVTLTLEEAAGIAPPPFDDQPELQISRRIERGAGSAYRVNGREMRARDVQTLFADLASGARSSAMVSQGRVSALVSARPEERRSILEEAAGITGLHARRHEAELKLRATESNLARADDLRLQLEARLSDLDAQSRQARRYREVAAGLREAEAGLLSLLHARARLAVQQAHEAGVATEAELAAAEQRAEIATLAEHAAELALPRPREAEAMARTSLERCRIAAETLEAEEQRAAQAAVEARARLSRAEAEAAAAAARLADADQALAALDAERATNAAGRAALPEREQAATQALQDAQAEQASAGTAHAEALAAENVLRNRIQQLEREQQAAASTMERLSGLAAALQAEHDEAEAGLPPDAALAALQAECGRAAQAVAQADADAEQAVASRGEAGRAADVAGLQAAEAARAHVAATSRQADAAQRATRLAAELATLAAQVAEAEAGRDGVADASDDAGVAEQELRLAEARHELAAAESARGEAQDAHALARRRLAESVHRHEQAASAEAAAEAMLGRARSQHTRIAGDVAAAEAALVAPSRLDEAAAALAAAQTALDSAASGLVEAEQERDRAAHEHGTAAQDLAAISADQARLQAQLDGLGPVEDGRGEDAGGPAWATLADTLTVPDGLERALGALLADGLDGALDPDAPRHWRTLDECPSPALPTGATRLSDLVAAPPALARALSHAGLVEETEGAALQATLAPGQSLVSRAGALWRWDGYSDTGGLAADSAAGHAVRALEQRRRMRETLRLLESCSEEAIAVRVRAAGLARDAAGQAETAAAARLRRNEAERALSVARDTHQDLSGRAGAGRARLDALLPQRDHAAAARDEADRALAEACSQRAGLPILETLESELREAARRDAEASDREARARDARGEAERRLETARRNVAARLAARAEIESRLGVLLPQLARIGEEEQAARAEMAAADGVLAAAADPATSRMAAARLRQAAEAAEAQEQRTRAARREAATRLDRLQSERVALSTRMVEQRSRLQALAPRLASVMAERREVAASLAAVQEARSALPDLDAAAAASHQAAGRLQAAREAEALQRDARLRIQGDAVALEAEAARLAASHEDWSRRAVTAREEEEAARIRLAADREAHDALAEAPALAGQHRRLQAAALADATRQHQAARQALDGSEQALLGAQHERRQADTALMQAREARLRLQGQSEQAQAILAQLLAETGTPPQDVPDDLSDNAEAGLRRRIARMIRERDEMGPVNLRADIESGEALARAEAIRAEREELDAAIARLRGSIGHLNREGRERLLAVFEQVDRHFQALFARMFNGGRAHLGMVGNDDPLQAGLEIYAQPPGKKLATLSLLSGGEQALTALSLIFAVFRCNPAPVCVLDEVDAPLDDANVGRFCALLGDMVTETGTRFLVVTHHQLTMAHMDRLYGVTMQERGVSRLLSVDLAAASAMTERQRETA
ncbi:AAA family ATPase [Lichenicoccus roseus]|uniref:Chromosome partition protein Smc n=1 Tax=Lichenicoccus roseus TaxID=2683649 RepID=A0A5R9JGE9_9PROT|nr:AAA family ATPase [Lichenicoccus roseus]TLU74496.1 chromosome segregation protein SMC [Lichenicoccus roseus]